MNTDIDLERAYHLLQLDAATSEPFLRLDPPHSHLVLTPLRHSDAPALVTHLNNYNITRTLNGPPYPYLESDAEWFLGNQIPLSDVILERLRQGAHPNGVPVRVLRDTSHCSVADAVMIGDCTIDRSGFASDVADVQQREILAKENEARPAGDPKIVYCVGDWLAEAYHGQGIMSAALRAIVHKWLVPVLNARHIIATAMLGNRASVRVFEKNGFRYVGDVQDTIQIVESKGGGKVGVHVLEWKLEDQEDPGQGTKAQKEEV